jgi:hypothetical protein
VEASDRRAAVSQQLEALQRLEKELESQWSELEQAGQGFGSVRAILADSEVSPDERSRHLRAADEAQQAFLNRLNDFLRLQQAYFMGQVVAELDHAMKVMDAFYGRRRIRSIYRRYRRLTKLAKRCRELEGLYGTVRDHRRIEVYQEFYAGVVAFARRIRALDPTMPKSPPDSIFDRLYAAQRGAIWFLGQFGNMVRLVIGAFRLIGTVLAKEPAASGTPFTALVDDFFRTLGEIKGYRVYVTGLEHVPRSTGGDAVHLFTPAHRHGVTDNITFAHLRLSDYLVFNAVDQLPIVPRSMKDRIATTNGLIPVGGGRGPAVERTLAVLARGISRNVLIYPEGSVSEGFRGTRPPRRNFGESLVRRIREAGHGVDLIPVTYLDNARFLDLSPRSNTPMDLRVVVSAPLDTAMIDALLVAGGGEMVNRMVRLAWLETLVTDERQFLGQTRVREIEKGLDLELDGIRYWGSVESAPVRDKLVTVPNEPVVVREEPFRRKRVRVFQLPESARNEEGGFALENLRSDDSNELLIGIRPPSHIYLSVGRNRFDGDIFRRLSVKQRDRVYPGIIVRFVDVPVKSLNAIRRKLEEFSGRERRTLTCANSACQVIARAANIEIDDHADMRPFLPSHVLPTRTIRKIIERGARNHSGGQIDTQIYTSDSRPLEATLAEMRRAEIRIAKDHLRMITVDACRAAVAAVRRLASRLRAGTGSKG